jgi:hypothetical protein
MRTSFDIVNKFYLGILWNGNIPEIRRREIKNPTP